MKISELVRKPKMFVGRTKRGMVLQPTEVEQDFAALGEESKPEYFNRLEKELGIERLGHGAFARVFKHPTHPEVAVKVFTDEDEAYHAYLKFAQANQGNKYIPKILSVHNHVNNPHKRDHDRNVDELVDDKYSIVFMEKLTPISPAKFDALEIHIGDLLGGTSINLSKLTAKQWETISEQKQDKDLAVFAKFMMRVLRSYDAFADLHEANVMLRGSQPVFTDPTS